MHYNVPATDAPQTWAVATWFILLVVTGNLFLLFRFENLFDRTIFLDVCTKYQTNDHSTL